MIKREGADLPISWSGWPDLNRRPLRPELAAPLSVWPSSQLDRCASGRDGWRLSGDVAVLFCCTPKPLAVFKSIRGS
jgi:hypothetical protein